MVLNFDPILSLPRNAQNDWLTLFLAENVGILEVVRDYSHKTSRDRVVR